MRTMDNKTIKLFSKDTPVSLTVGFAIIVIGAILAAAIAFLEVRGLAQQNAENIQAIQEKQEADGITSVDIRLQLIRIETKLIGIEQQLNTGQ